MNLNNYFNQPEFKEILKQLLSQHERLISIGQHIRSGYSEPLAAFPLIPDELIAVALIATCSTEVEIKKVLSNAGFAVREIEILEKPSGDDIMEQELFVFSQVIAGALTKEGLPCNFLLRKLQDQQILDRELDEEFERIYNILDEEAWDKEFQNYISPLFYPPFR